MKNNITKQLEKSPYLNGKHQKRLEVTKNMGERKASYQTKMEDLLAQKNEIEKKIFLNDSADKINKMTKKNEYDYLTLDPNKMNKSASEAYGNSIQETRDKINKLIKDRNATLDEYKANLNIGQSLDNIDYNHNSDFYGNHILISFRQCKELYFTDTKITRKSSLKRN